jgi:glucan phosphorylase
VRDPKSVTVWSKIDGVDELAELALNLHWSWNHASDELWKRLDQDTWESTQNPWVILQTVSKEKIEAALALPEFRKLLDEVIGKNARSYASDAWFQKKASSAESVGRFRFRELTKRVIHGHFHGFVGAKAERSSGNHSYLVVETLDSAA